MANISLRFLGWSTFLDRITLRSVAQPSLVAPPISLRRLGQAAAGRTFVIKQGVAALQAEDAPKTTPDSEYQGAPLGLMEPNQQPEGRVAQMLREAAQMRDGTKILKWVAFNRYINLLSAAANSVDQLTDTQLTKRQMMFVNNQPAADGVLVSQDMLTAMTQLAVTGSNAFSKWSQNAVFETDLITYLTGIGMPADLATAASNQIMADFWRAQHAVRTPQAGKNWADIRKDIQTSTDSQCKWIAVSAEDDPPDYPVNVFISPYPQFHQKITVPTPAMGAGTSVDLDIRYILASTGDDAALSPSIPPEDEVLLYIHGEGSRAEEACDLIPKLRAVAATANRTFTVIALDLPGSGYTTRIKGGVHETPIHREIAEMPASNFILNFYDAAPFVGSPVLDFVQDTISTFVETAIIQPFGERNITIIGGSLGGHMALRFAASDKGWVRNVIAWSPASVWEYTFSICGIPIDHRRLTDPKCAGAATDIDPSALEPEQTRRDFFSTVWDKPTFAPDKTTAAEVAAAIMAAASIGIITLPVGMVAELLIQCYMQLHTSPPQATQWYRDDWPSKPVPPKPFGDAKINYMDESRWDRWDVYNTNFRQWHFRISEELIGFQFDPNTINKPLQLMAGQADDYDYVHFVKYVTDFAGKLSGPGRALTVQDTGHSIHNERPTFLANQIIEFPVL
jgi:pimeloyl-ACP methyl ester carboxylesterase